MLRAFARVLVTFDRAKLEPAIAFRNSLGVVLPLAVGIAVGMPLGGLAVATGALQVAYSDGHDPYSQRSFRMFTSTALCALAVVVGGLCGRSFPLTILAIGIWSFCSGMAVVLGADAESLGVVSLVTLIIFSAQALTVTRALNSGALALAGGLIQTGLSIALWPLARRQPERRALSRLYARLSTGALAAMHSKEAPVGTAEMTHAQDALVRLGRDVGAESQRLWSMLNQAERIRLRLLTLGRLRNRLSRDEQHACDAEAVDTYLRQASSVLAALADTIVTHKEPAALRDALRDLRHIADTYRAKNGPQDNAFVEAVRVAVLHQMDSLAGQLRSVYGLATDRELQEEPLFGGGIRKAGWRERVAEPWSKIRANFDIQSPGFRHALRLSVTLMVAQIMAHAINARRSYWLPMTVSLILKPEFAITFTRGVLRIVGTMAGLALSTALFHFLHPVAGTEVLLLMFFVFMLRWLGPANYGVFAVFVSGVVVLMVAFTGVVPQEVILIRGVMTTLGGIVALAAYAVWPTWENLRLPELFAKLLESYRAYSQSIGALLQDAPITDTELASARLEARRARTALESALDRLRLEPRSNAAKIRQLSSMLASSHRFINAAMTLEASVRELHPERGREALVAFFRDLDRTFAALVQVLRTGSSPASLPDLRADHRALLEARGTDTFDLLLEETDRMSNSLNTLSEQVLQFAAPSPAREQRQPAVSPA